MKGTVKVEGGRIRVTDTRGDGPALVLLHGDWTDAGIWSPVIPLLRDSFRVIGYSEPGYGDSPPPTQARTRLDNLRSLLDLLEIERVVLVAHSGGSNPALALAIDEPERVRKLVLIAPGTHDYPWPLDDPYFTEMGRLGKLGNHGGLVELGLRTWAASDFADSGAFPRRPAESGVARVARAQFRHAVASWDTVATLGVECPPVYERLTEVTAPAAVLVGDADHPMVQQSSRDIAERLSGATLTVVPGADHLLPLRTPSAVADAAGQLASA